MYYSVIPYTNELRRILKSNNFDLNKSWLEVNFLRTVVDLVFFFIFFSLFTFYIFLNFLFYSMDKFNKQQLESSFFYVNKIVRLAIEDVQQD